MRVGAAQLLQTPSTLTRTRFPRAPSAGLAVRQTLEQGPPRVLWVPLLASPGQGRAAPKGMPGSVKARGLHMDQQARTAQPLISVDLRTCQSVFALVSNSYSA